jgi:serine/threonine protein kinase
MSFQKCYPTDCFIDPLNTIKIRIDKIEQIAAIMDFIPETRFEWKKNELIYRQKFIKRNSFNKLEKDNLIYLLVQFACDLDELAKTSFIHGDINRKNVLYCGNRLWLVDLEPALRIIKNGRSTLLFTPPYISLEDLKNKKLTQQSDKIGFYFFARKLIDSSFKLKNISNLMRQRIEQEFEFLPIPEAEFVNQSYEDILNELLLTYPFQ